MTAAGWAQIALFFAVVLALAKPVGAWLHRAYEGPPLWPRLERLLVGEVEEQSWAQYAIALLLFSAIGMLVTYAIERLQGVLPLNPRHLPAIAAALAFDTAASFTTNTNWQSYTPETTVSYLTQMAGLAWHNFTSAAVGLGAALALARGLTGRRIGNFWQDLMRGVVYVFLPACVVYALFLVSQGAIQNLSPYLDLTTLSGAKQTLAMGPAASQEAIKMLGTNGGGFFNANSAHPFENPTPLTNFVQLVSIFAIPAGLTWTYGKMARDQRQGWALFAAMAVLFFAGVATTYAAEVGNLEGKEVRFGVAGSALFATVTTDASCGAVNSMHDSFTALGGLVPLVNIQLGEVIFGGVGAGLYGILVFVLLTVFIAGLMVGRTPEYLGKKIEAREMKLAMLYVLIFPLLILGGTAWSAVRAAPEGPHALTRILYAWSSGAGNNGSAFAGLDANTTFWNVALGFEMLIGRFLMLVPALAIGGSMARKKVIPAGPGTFPTNGALFVALLVAVVVVVGALTFFPALSLGPIAEHFAAKAGRTW